MSLSLGGPRQVGASQPRPANAGRTWPTDPFLLLPAIDLRGGRCVRLRQGDFAQQTTYGEDPLVVAQAWQAQGARALHLVDLDGAAAGAPVQLDVLRRLSASLNIPVQWGGGLRSPEAVAAALAAGAARVVVGTRAVADAAFLARLLAAYPGQVVVALDARNGRVATHGWQSDSGLSLAEAAVLLSRSGAGEVLYTDISRDGMLGGPDVAGVRALAAAGLHVLASGGVTSPEDVAELASLANLGVAGAIVGKALYEGRLTLAGALAAARAAGRQTAGPSGLARRIIPCLDVKDGRVVKGVRFAHLRDAGDPVALARLYDQAGADELVFYDISASAEGRRTMLDVVERTAQEAFIPLTVGGGIGSVADVYNLLRAGADKVSINSQAVANPQLITAGAERFGSQCIVLGVDARQVYEADQPTGRWEVVTHGGRRPTGMDLIEWVTRAERLGAGEIVLNSIDADGTKDGYDLAATRAVAEAVRVPVVASGGAGKLDDFYQALTAGGADAALAASLFHYGTLTIAAVKEYLAGRGVPVRLTAGGTSPAGEAGPQALPEEESNHD